MNRPQEHETHILIVEDDEGLAELLRDEVEDAGWCARLASTAEDALTIAKAWRPEVIVSDLRLPGADGLALLKEVRAQIPERTPDVLIITAFGTVAKAVESLKAGAEDFLTKPLDLDHFKLSIDRILEKRAMREQIRRMKNLLDEDATFHGMYGRCPAMLTLFEQIRRAARADGPVLIAGKSGTGKELVARAVHEESGYAAGPFLAVNCAGIPEHLLESEFFGHEAGAFTGAGKARKGLFAEAEGGTLLLDEIAEMPAALQSKLLRMLEDGSIRPVGGNCEQQVNVRVVAATNRDIEERVRDGDFRDDLFYRLETFTLHVPSLREREDDIELLSALFVAHYASASGKDIKGFGAAARDLLHRYPFPGNVRELRNAVERAVAFCRGVEIRPEDLPERIRRGAAAAVASSGDPASDAFRINDESLPPLDEIERRYIAHVMTRTNGNKRMAAKILGIGRRTLYRRLGEMEE